MTGALLEALNCEYYKVVRPKYIDVSLKTKIARDDNSAAMLDLILSSRTVDIGDVVFASTIRGTVTNLFLAKDTNVSSAFEANRTSLEKLLKDAMGTADK